MTVCAICDAIGEKTVANTGRGEHLPATTRALVSLGWASDNDIWRCPTCGNLYWYVSEQAQTGSGNNDDDTLTRLSPAEADALRAIVDRGEIRVEAVFALQWSLRDLVIDRVYASHRDLFRTLVPRIVEEIAAGRDSYALNSSLYALASEPADARTILGLVGASEKFRYLRDKCEQTLAATQPP